MPRRDRYHYAVRNALAKDGWHITHDPFPLVIGQRDVYIDLGAESRPFAAEREGLKILVEVKSFIGVSDITDLHLAIGQYIFYRSHLADKQIDRTLYLAVPETAYAGVWSEPAGRVVIEAQGIKFLVFDVEAEVITRWIS